MKIIETVSEAKDKQIDGIVQELIPRNKFEFDIKAYVVVTRLDPLTIFQHREFYAVTKREFTPLNHVLTKEFENIKEVIKLNDQIKDIIIKTLLSI